MSKSFTIIIDREPQFVISISNTATIGQIKKYFIDYLAQQQLDPNRYSISIYINPNTMLDIGYTNAYDNVTLDTVWDQINNPYIVLSITEISYLNTLPKDVLYSMFLNTEMDDLLNLCLTSKELYAKICQSDDFWCRKLFHDFQIVPTEIGGKINCKRYYPIIKKGFTDANEGMVEAAKHGYRDMVDFFMRRGADDYVKGIYASAEGGNENLFYYFVGIAGPIRINYKELVYHTAIGGNQNIINFAMKLSRFTVNDMLKAMFRAGQEGNEQVVGMLIRQKHGREKRVINEGLRGAAAGNNLELIDFFIGAGAENFMGAEMAATDPNVKNYIEERESETNIRKVKTALDFLTRK